MNDRLCIFCFKSESDKTPWCPPPNSGRNCTYGYGHEYPEAEVKASVVKPRDAKLCVKCGLHPRNPLSTTNECAHEYK